ncbi:hypothetical protein AAC387_Pa11g1173 [Persea americana]
MEALHWHPPPTGVVKLNVDGVIFENVQKAGVGAVLRDEKGNVIMALSKIETWVAKADDIEAVAALRGLQMVLTIERESNALAHKLAGHAQFVDDTNVWWFSMPKLIMQNVIEDSTCL